MALRLYSISILIDQAVSASSIFEPVVIEAAGDADVDLLEMESWHIPAAERPIKNKKPKNKKKFNNNKKRFNSKYKGKAHFKKKPKSDN